jgi:hypothetical protein
MLQLSVGIVIGFLLFAFIFALEVALAKKGTGLLQPAKRALETRFAPKGAVIQPPDELALARQEILRANQEKGQSTPLEQIL